MFVKNIVNLCKVAWQCVAGLREGVGVFFHSFISIFLCCVPQGNSLGYRHKCTNSRNVKFSYVKFISYVNYRCLCSRISLCEGRSLLPVQEFQLSIT